MKHSLNVTRYGMMLMAMLSLIVGACSSHDSAPLLDNVPADAVAVININAEKIIENTGSTITDGKVELSEQMNDLVEMFFKNDRALITKIIDSQCIDYKSIVMAQSNEVAYVLVTVTDEDKLIDVFNSLNIKHEKEHGWIEFDSDNDSYLKDGILWLCLKSDEREDLEKFIADAQKNPYSGLTWQLDYLNRESAINALFNIDKFDTILKSQMAENAKNAAIKNGFIAMTGNFEGQSFKMAGLVNDVNGKKITYGGKIQDIDTFFTKYLASEDIAVMATALPENFDWEKAIAQAMLAYGGYSDNKTLSIIAGVLNSLDGTVAIGAGPSSGLMSFANANPSNWDVVLAAQTKDGMVDSLISKLSLMLAITGMNISEQSDGIIASNGWLNISVKKDGNKVIISNRNTSVVGNSPIAASAFTGKTSELIIQMPKDNEIMASLGVPFGVQIEVSSADDEFKGEVKLLDTNELFLAGIVKLITAKL